MKAISERVRRLLTRKHSYRACFQEGDGKTLTPSGESVMQDLARFCGVYKSNMPLTLNKSVDTHAMAVAEGRRQVYLRLLAQLNVKDSDILKEDEA